MFHWNLQPWRWLFWITIFLIRLDLHPVVCKIIETIYQESSVNGQLNDTITRISVLLDSDDGVLGENNVRTLLLNADIAYSNGAVVTTTITCTYSDPYTLYDKQCKGASPMQIRKIILILRASRMASSDLWYSGIVPPSSSFESLENMLALVNPHSTALLLQREGVRLESQSNTASDRRRVAPKRVNKSELRRLARNAHDVSLAHIIKLKYQDLEARGFHVMDNGQGTSTALNLALRPTSSVDITDVANDINNVNSGSVRANIKSTATQLVQENQLIADTQTIVAKEFSASNAVINQTLTILGPDFIAYQTQFNATAATLLNSVQENLDLRNTTQQRMQSLFQTSNDALNDISIGTSQLKIQDNEAFNTSQKVEETMIYASQALRTGIDMALSDMDSTAIYARDVNNVLLNIRLNTDANKARVDAMYQSKTFYIHNKKEVPFLSVANPATNPSPDGKVPLSTTVSTAGYMFRFTEFSITSQPLATLSTYTDTDMNLILDYNSRTPNSPQAIRYQNLLRTNEGNGFIRYAHLNEIQFICNNEYYLKNRNNIQSIFDMISLIGPPNCNTNGTCNCYFTIRQERCATDLSSEYIDFIHNHANNPPGSTFVGRQLSSTTLPSHVYTFGGCHQSGSLAEQESAQWFSDGTVANPVTGKNQITTYTTSSDITRELQRICSKVLSTATILVDGSTTTTTTVPGYYMTWSSYGVNNFVASVPQFVLNQPSSCSTDDNIMILQTKQTGALTLPYAFYSQARWAMQLVLDQIGPKWITDTNGDLDRDIVHRIFPFQLETMQDVASPDIMTEQHAMCYTTTSADMVPIYLWKKITTIQTMVCSFVNPSTGDTVTIPSVSLTNNVDASNALPTSFTTAGYANCWYHSCLKPLTGDSAYDPAGVLNTQGPFVLDVVDGSITASNITSLRDHSPDCIFSRIDMLQKRAGQTVSVPTASLPNVWNYLNPIPVMTSDDYIAQEDLALYDASKCSASLHHKTRSLKWTNRTSAPCAVDSSGTPSLNCRTIYCDPSEPQFDQIMCTNFKVAQFLSYDFRGVAPYEIDLSRTVAAYHLNWQALAVMDIPGSNVVVESLGAQDVCFSPTQISLYAGQASSASSTLTGLLSASIQLPVLQISSAFTFDVTILFTTSDASGSNRASCATSTTYIVVAGRITSLVLPITPAISTSTTTTTTSQYDCMILNLAIQAQDPVSSALISCWSNVVNITQDMALLQQWYASPIATVAQSSNASTSILSTRIADVYHVDPEAASSTNNATNAAIAQTASSIVAQSNTNMLATAASTALLTKTYVSNVFELLKQYTQVAQQATMQSQTSLASADGQPVMFVDPRYGDLMKNIQQALLQVNQQYQNLLLVSQENQLKFIQAFNAESAALTQDYNALVDAIQVERSQLIEYKAFVANQSIFWNANAALRANLVNDMNHIALESQASVATLRRQAESAGELPEPSTSMQAVFKNYVWTTQPGSFLSQITDIVKAAGTDLLHLAEFLNPFDSSCPFGLSVICWLQNIWKYILIAIVVLLGIGCLICIVMGVVQKKIADI